MASAGNSDEGGLEWFLLWIFFPLCLVTTLVFLGLRPMEEYDIWFHMAYARQVLDQGSIPRGDVFSFTSPGREWISTGWLSSMILYGLWEKIGKGQSVIGLAAFVEVQLLIAWLAAYFWGQRKKCGGSTTILLLVGMVVGCLRFNPRPDLCSQFLMSITLLILIGVESPDPFQAAPNARQKRRPLGESFRSIPRTLWALPIITCLWGNLHAGFLVGIVCIGIFAAWRFLIWRLHRRPLDGLILVPCGISMATWVINPYGLALLKLPSKIKAAPGVTEMLFEWMPLYVPGGQGLPMVFLAFLAILVLLWIVALVTGARRTHGWTIVAGLFFLYITWTARRQMGLTALALPILAIPHLDRLERWFHRLRSLRIVAIAGITVSCLYFGGILLGGGFPSVRMAQENFPSGAVQFLKRNPPPPNLFNSYHFGGYLMYYLGPKTKVFIDGRIDTYDPQVWVDDRNIEAGNMSLDDAIEKYGLNTFLLDSRSGYDPGRMAQRLAARPDMAMVYMDENSVIFVRKSAATEDYLTRSLSP